MSEAVFSCRLLGKSKITGRLMLRVALTVLLCKVSPQYHSRFEPLSFLVVFCEFFLEFTKTKLSFIPYILMHRGAIKRWFFLFACWFAWWRGGEGRGLHRRSRRWRIFLVRLMTRRRRPRASQEKKDRGGFFGISFVMDNCVLELGYEGQFIFIFAQKVT